MEAASAPTAGTRVAPAARLLAIALVGLLAVTGRFDAQAQTASQPQNKTTNKAASKKADKGAARNATQSASKAASRRPTPPQGIPYAQRHEVMQVADEIAG